MPEEHRLSLQRETSLPKWFDIGKWQIQTILYTLFRLSCWTTAAWVVWNHALSNFLNAGRIGPLLSFGLGVFLHVMSVILEDPEP